MVKILNKLNARNADIKSHSESCFEYVGDASPFWNEELTGEAFSVMNNMRKQELFCDVFLETDGGFIFPAHKMLLGACSPYFMEILLYFEEKNQSHIKIQGVDCYALKLLIDYVYTARININMENVKVLLPAANLMQFNEIRDACFHFLKAKLHPSNCWQIRTLADIHGCQKLLKYVDKFIDLNFSEFIKTDEFLGLSLEDISRVIDSNRLLILTEETVFECVVSWINFSLRVRKDHLLQLMEYIRLPLINTNYLLHNIREEPLIENNLQCDKFLFDALEYQLAKNDQKISSKFKGNKMTLQRGERRVLLVIKFLGDRSEFLDLIDEKWYEGPEIPALKNETPLLILEGQVYLIGSGFSQIIDVTRYGYAVLEKRIYIVGGFNEGEEVNSVEIYDPQTNEWQEMLPMLMERADVGIGIVDGLLYVVGGSSNGEILSSVEYYDPEKDEWKLVAEMSQRRKSAGVGVIDGILYAVGGTDDFSVFKSAEAFNPETNQWSIIPDMEIERHNPGVVGFNEKLYVVGGYNKDMKGLNSVEVYSPKTNSWTTLSSNMNFFEGKVNLISIDIPRFLTTSQ